MVTGRRIVAAGAGADRRDEHHAGADRKPAAEPAQLPELRRARAGRHPAPIRAARSSSRPARCNADHSNVLLDGMSFKNPINHGGMFGQNFGVFGNPFPQIAIQEYQVQTQNFGAEIGQSASAPCSPRSPRPAATNSTATIFIEWQPKAFIYEAALTQTGPKQDYDRKQFGGDIGGPIIPGKLTFYVAFEGREPDKSGRTLAERLTVRRSRRTSRPRSTGRFRRTFKQRLVLRQADLVRDARRHREPDRLQARPEQSQRLRRQCRRQATAACSRPTRRGSSCSGGTAPAISSTS